MSFSLTERKKLGVEGLLPAVTVSRKHQVAVAMRNFERCATDLDRFIFLMDILSYDAHLFFQVITEHIVETMPIIYTPTVGLACQNYGLIFRRPM